MTCIQFGTGKSKEWICGLPDKQAFICFEHTTYLMEFSRQFGPSFFRMECGKEIEIDIGFNDNDEPTSNKFLWDIFEKWHYRDKEKSD